MTPDTGILDLHHQFLEAQRALFGEIRAFGADLHEKQLQIRQRTIGMGQRESGEAYEANILSYVLGLQNLAQGRGRAIELLSHKVTALLQKSRDILPAAKADGLRRKTWLAFAGTLENFSGRPSKKVAALLIDSEDRLLAWDTNHLCYGVTPQVALYVKGGDGERGVHIWCAERNILVQYLGLAARPANTDITEIHRAIGVLTRELTDAARKNSELKKLTMVSSHQPCIPCVDVIVPECGENRMPVVADVITRWNQMTEELLTGPHRHSGRARGILCDHFPKLECVGM